MNKRIKELYGQAAAYTCTLFINGVNNTTCPPEYVGLDPHLVTATKFAELIVKECIEQAELEEDRFTGLDAIDLAHAMQNFQNLLKQHFGVE